MKATDLLMPFLGKLNLQIDRANNPRRRVRIVPQIEVLNSSDFGEEVEENEDAEDEEDEEFEDEEFEEEFDDIEEEFEEDEDEELEEEEFEDDGFGDDEDF